MKYGVSLCMIVKDEQHNLPACLTPVADLFDEIVVVDTGSADRTKEVAAQWGARVYDFVWSDDFSAARNETLRHATGRWIFWLDADDRIDAANRQRLEAVFRSLGAERAVYAMQCVSHLADGANDCWVTHLRLFPRDAGLRWRRRVHEMVLGEDLRMDAELRWTDVVIQHVGYSDRVIRRNKRRRDLRLLQLDFALNPDDPYTLFYLGWTHLALENVGGALRFLQRSLKREPRIRKAYTLLIDALCREGRQGEAMETARAGLGYFPEDTELLYHHACLQGKSGDLAGAERQFRRLVDGPVERYMQVGVEGGLRGEKAHFMLGLICQEQGRLADAETEYRLALAAQPESARAWLGLGQLYLGQQRWRELEEAVARLRACPGGNVWGIVLATRACIQQRQFAAAHALLDEAIALAPQMVWPRLVLYDLARAEGADLKTLIGLQRAILELNPQQAYARRELETLLQQQKKQAAAAPSPHPTADFSYGSNTSILVTGW